MSYPVVLSEVRSHLETITASQSLSLCDKLHETLRHILLVFGC